MKKLFYLLCAFSFSCSQESDSKKTGLIESPNVYKRHVAAEPAETFQSEAAPEYDTWTFDKVEGTKLLFKEGPAFDTELYNLEYIGQIDIDQKAPFLIYSGRDCDECDANIAIYFHSPRKGQLTVGHWENKYGYPGKERAYETGSLVYQAKAYYGEVLPGAQGLVWYQKTLLEDNSFQNSVYLAKLEGDSIKGEEMKGYDKYLKETLALNKAGKNKEIRGRDYTTEP